MYRISFLNSLVPRAKGALRSKTAQLAAHELERCTPTLGYDTVTVGRFLMIDERDYRMRGTSRGARLSCVKSVKLLAS
jgi:hypothetical protein